MSKTYHVYKITNLETHQYYIGLTSRLVKRQNAHYGLNQDYSPCKWNKEICNFEVLFSSSDKKEALNKENEYIDSLKSDLCLNFGNNKELASNAGKISAIKSPKDKEYLENTLGKWQKENPDKVKANTENWRMAGSKAPKPGLWKQIIVTEPNGNERTFPNLQSIIDYYPKLVSKGNISSCCNGKKRDYKSYTFQYLENHE